MNKFYLLLPFYVSFLVLLTNEIFLQIKLPFPSFAPLNRWNRGKPITGLIGYKHNSASYSNWPTKAFHIENDTCGTLWNLYKSTQMGRTNDKAWLSDLLPIVYHLTILILAVYLLSAFLSPPSNIQDGLHPDFPLLLPDAPGFSFTMIA